METKIIKFTAILLIMAGLCSCTPTERLEKEPEELPEEPVTVLLTEYSLEGSGCQWTNLGYDSKVIIINSKEDLEKYLTCTEGGFPEVDFSEYTLLLAYGTSTYGVQKIHPELLSTGDEYVLKIEITQNDATVVESWHIALVTDKIAEKAGVVLTVKIAGLQGTMRIIRILKNEPAYIRKQCLEHVGRRDTFLIETTAKYKELGSSGLFPCNAIPEEYRIEDLPVKISGEIYDCFVAGGCIEPHISLAACNIFKLESIKLNKQ